MYLVFCIENDQLTTHDYTKKNMIVPALLTDKKENLEKMLDLCSGFTDFVQIDVMDGEFVPSTSIGPKDLDGLGGKIRSEAHIMAQDPLSWLDAFKGIGSERIIYHFEANCDHAKTIETIKACGCEVGIAINPPTTIEQVEPWIDKVDSVLFMSVIPGFYGAPFIPEVLNKIREFKKIFPDKVVGIDGGVKLNNVKEIADSGVDYICVGSALLKAGNPKEAYERFLGELGIV
ncbi:MAG: ribulose-phosphate 3-epimerase [Candidatus Omnitrophica bacterium]|nr:ribulose-phosphate 3-epimerase [Candidatus Omnitrophota bacterium]